jgi:probable phosphoglycerate mutase
MLRIVLVRPGCTDFDQQGRIKGTLDIPLCVDGSAQAKETAEQLGQFSFDAVYSAPCSSARQTAEIIAGIKKLKVKLIEDLHNIDHGLWHGKLIDEVKQTQPRVYRLGQEHADSICPPQGEPIAAGRERVRRLLARVLKKHPTGDLCLVTPEPLASVVESELQHCELTDLWKSERDNGSWNVYEVTPDPGAEPGFRSVAAESGVPVTRPENRSDTRERELLLSRRA